MGETTTKAPAVEDEQVKEARIQVKSRESGPTMLAIAVEHDRNQPVHRSSSVPSFHPCYRFC